MKKSHQKALWYDIIIVILLGILHPLSPITPCQPFTPPYIPDKVEIRHHRTITAETAQQEMQQIKAKLDEMRFYFKVHKVTDRGYNQVAQYRTTLESRHNSLRRYTEQGNRKEKTGKTSFTRIEAKDRPLIAVKLPYGYWRAGHFHLRPLTGKAISQDYNGRIISAVYENDSILFASRSDSTGLYNGQMNAWMQASGQGTFEAANGEYYEGQWHSDLPHNFGFKSSPYRHLQVGEWKFGRFLGERIRYTDERVYGIDISRHQHEKGRRRYAINWQKVRITSLGARHNSEGRTFPVSFVYIKSTEGTTIRNRYFLSDYRKAKKQGIRVGAYHFFSLKSPAKAQANYFVNHTLFRKGDFPPVLDVEPTDAQVRKIGGDEVLMNRIRAFMEIVERRTGMRPILYVNQRFINKHMKGAADIKHRYNVWIARYGEYKPDVKLVYWQLCQDGKVDGIKGPVDINVFNGYQTQYDEFVQNGFYK